MQSYTKTVLEDRIVLNPKTPPTASVIWLHGLGADGDDFVPIVRELNLPDTLSIRFIFPHAPMQPVTINNGYVMRAWFDIYSTHIDRRIDHDGVKQSVERVQGLIAGENQAGIPAERIILAGFSQGAVIALCTGLQYPERLAGIMALSGFLPQANDFILQASLANRSTPLFVAHGTYDNVLPCMLGKQTADFLKQYDYPVEWHQYEMPHSVCSEEINDIANWIKNCVT